MGDPRIGVSDGSRRHFLAAAAGGGAAALIASWLHPWQGVTLIVGGGYNGKSTLLDAVEKGVYNRLSMALAWSPRQ